MDPLHPPEPLSLSLSFSINIYISCSVSLSLSLHVFIYLYIFVNVIVAQHFSLFFFLCSSFVYSDFLFPFCLLFCLLFFLLTFTFTLSFSFYSIFFSLVIQIFGWWVGEISVYLRELVSLMQPLLRLTQTNSGWLFLDEWRSILIFSKLFLKKHKLK